MALVGGNLSLDPLLPNPKRQRIDETPTPRLRIRIRIKNPSPCPNCDHLFVYKGTCISCNSKVDKPEGTSFDYIPNPKRQRIDETPTPRLRIRIKNPSPCPNCDHLFVYKGTCISCNSKVDKPEGTSFDYIDKDIKMSNEGVKRNISRMSWLEDKKLHLVLDLDHTLLHSVLVSKLSESEKYLIEEAETRKDLWRYNIGKPDEFLIKLRPFVHQFLEEANKFFSMYVYTKGDYDYAKYVMELIDPKKCYFEDRVITRRESPGFKTLDLVLADERGVVIVDDKRSVWPEHKRNLLQIAKYRYFKRTMESKGFYSVSSGDESDENGVLASVLRFLKEVYEGFFSECSEEKLDSVDVRPLLRDPLSSKRKNISETRLDIMR